MPQSTAQPVEDTSRGTMRRSYLVSSYSFPDEKGCLHLYLPSGRQRKHTVGAFSSNFFHPYVNLRQHTEPDVSMSLLSRFKGSIISQSYRIREKCITPELFTVKLGVSLLVLIQRQDDINKRNFIFTLHI